MSQTHSAFDIGSRRHGPLLKSTPFSFASSQAFMHSCKSCSCILSCTCVVFLQERLKNSKSNKNMQANIGRTKDNFHLIFLRYSFDTIADLFNFSFIIYWKKGDYRSILSCSFSPYVSKVGSNKTSGKSADDCSCCDNLGSRKNK